MPGTVLCAAKTLFKVNFQHNTINTIIIPNLKRGDRGF